MDKGADLFKMYRDIEVGLSYRAKMQHYISLNNLCSHLGEPFLKFAMTS